MHLPFARIQRSLLLAGLLAGSSALSARAAIVFQFSYTDPAGTGLNDGSAQSTQVQAAVAYTGALLGNMFANNAVITVGVASENIPGSSTLAFAGSSTYYPVSNGNPVPGFYDNVVQTKVFTGTDQNGAATDATATINLGKTFQFNPTAMVGAGQVDFVSTFMHELTHALGFASMINSPNPSTTTGGEYSIFDSYLSDSAGNPLIDHSTFTFNSARLGTLTGGNNTRQATPSPTGEFFNGPRAKLGLNGQLVPIYSPNPYQVGSSGSHTDDNSTITYGELMNAATAGGPGPRGYSPAEMGMMTDLGYTFAAVPEPATNALLLVAGAGLAWVGILRRKLLAARR